MMMSRYPLLFRAAGNCSNFPPEEPTEEPLQEYHTDILIQHDFTHEQDKQRLISQILENPAKLLISPTLIVQLETSAGNVWESSSWN